MYWLGVMWIGMLPLVCTAQLTEPIHLEQGRLTGMPNADGSIRVYKGIPYATPPVGDLRWRPPQPPSAWNGTLEAESFGPGCIQHVAGVRLPWTKEFMHQGSISEDCLFLNIWTGASAAEERQPVLVYIHGGGFREGSGSVEAYDGEALAKKGLVVLTINYRLGVFGFLVHPELSTESVHEVSGNYGLLDQVAALQWIRKNIAAFGGDPNNVTIAGQSAGAMSVYLLTAAPLANGLFHRAIVQSGPGALAAFGITNTRSLARPLSEAEKDGVEFARKVGANSLQELRAIAVDGVAAASSVSSIRFGPVIDGEVLPDDVPNVYAMGLQNDVPMMTGFNADEGSAFPGYGQSTAESYVETVTSRYGESSERFLALYPASTDQEAAVRLKTSQRDMAAVALGQVATERIQYSSTETFLYYFERSIPWPEHPEFGAFHTAEVPYFFANLHFINRPWETADWRLADVMSSYWVNFATLGTPNGPGLPSWPTYDENNIKFIKLGTSISPTTLTDKPKSDFFLNHLSK